MWGQSIMTSGSHAPVHCRRELEGCSHSEKEDTDRFTSHVQIHHLIKYRHMESWWSSEQSCAALVTLSCWQRTPTNACQEMLIYVSDSVA